MKTRLAPLVAAVLAVTGVFGAAAGTAGATTAGMSNSDASASRTGSVSAASSALTWRVTYILHIADGALQSITAPANYAVWAIGHTHPKSGTGYPFLLHWNGRVWRKTGMPVTGFHPTAIRSSSPSNVWMFGLNRSKSPKVLRWNGKRWLSLPGPSLAVLGLLGEAVISPTDVWAANQGAVSRWDGSRWLSLPSPTDFVLQQVGASSATNVWVAGVTESTGVLSAYRWRAGAWHGVAMPHPAAKFVSLAVQSATSVWITGVISLARPLLHWNGSSWQRMADRAAYTPLPLAPYGIRGVWASADELWTGRSWVSVPVPGSVPIWTPVDLAAVPRTTSAWLAVNSLEGPVILRD